MEPTSRFVRSEERCSRFTALILASVLALACLAGTPARAGVTPVPFQDWSETFLLRASAASTDTLVRFGFNPFTASGLGPGGYPPDDIMPSTTATIVIDVPAGTDLLTGFEILIAMDQALGVRAPGEPVEGAFAFQLLGETGDADFDVMLDITTSGGGLPAPGSWTFFNPQPEPPAFGDGAAAAGFAFQFSSFSEAQVVLQIEDSQGNSLSFVDVPEPGTLLLTFLGLVVLIPAVRPAPDP